MKTYFYTGSSSLITVKDNNIKSFDSISNSYLNIDWSWIIEEDGIFVANEKEYEVKAGDVILVLYAGYKEQKESIINRRRVRDFVIVRNEDLYNNFKLNKEAEQRQKNENCTKSCCSPEPCEDGVVEA